MRITRKRTAAKLAAEFVDPDSDELLELINEEDSQPASRKQQQKSRGNSKRRKGNPAAAADDSDTDYQPEASAGVAGQAAAAAQQEEPASADVDDQPASAADGSDGEDGAAASDDDEEDEEEDEDSSSPPPAGKGKRQQQKAQKKPCKKRLSTRRLCVTYARAQYKLTERDLDALTDVEYRDNPHYASAPPMRLYLVRELEELAAAKAARKAQEAATKEERAAERAMEARARKAAAAAAAAEKAAAFDTHTPKKEGHGSVALPDTCLARIMTCLAETLEPGGLRGPSAVAADLARAAEVCWDFYHAAKVGFVALSDATKGLYAPAQHPVNNPRVPLDSRPVASLKNLPGPENLGGWSFWDTTVQRPTELKLPQLKDAARFFGLQVTGTKAELMLRVLDAFHLSSPTTAPAALLRALSLERVKWRLIWDGPDAARQGEQLRLALDQARNTKHPAGLAAQAGLGSGGAAGLRAALMEAGFNSTTHYLEAAAAAYKVWMDQLRAQAEAEAARRRALERERMDAARRRWQEEAQHQQERVLARAQQFQQQQAMANAQQQLGAPPLYNPLAGVVHGNRCPCGQTAAKACSRGCCKTCCVSLRGAPGVAYCSRHNA